jgi:uncharacterized protein (TIGR02145 family)
MNKMKTKKYLLVMIATVFLFAGCSKEAVSELELPENEQVAERTFSLTVTMPGEQTRISLTEQPDKVSLAWVVGDEIQLSFEQGGNKIKVDNPVTVKAIEESGKKAIFDIVIPTGIVDGNFTLYGVYGGGGIDDANPTIAKLPENTGNAQSLESVQDRKDVMLYFKSSLSTDDPNAEVQFTHLGSLFSITVRYVGNTPVTNLNEARLVSSTAGNWAGAGGGSFDLSNEQFVTTSGTTGDHISFKAAKSSLVKDELITFWGWYSPLKDTAWPPLSLQLRDNTGNVLAATGVADAKPARTAATGQSYYLYAQWDESDLEFSDAIDADGNFYTTIKMGDQMWMAESLRTTKYNDGTPIFDASTGANWNAITNDAEGGYTTRVNTPFIYYTWGVVNTGKLCPPGWHVPSEIEFNTLFDYVKNTYGNGTSFLKELADNNSGITDNWANSTTAGAVGNNAATTNNASGFSMAPLRHRNAGTTAGGNSNFSNSGHYSTLWTSTSSSDANARVFILHYSYSASTTNFMQSAVKASGYSVRCVRD